VRAEDDRAPRRHLVELLDEDRAFRAQVVHHELVVHDLVAHVYRRAILLEGALDDLDRAIDAGTETAGLGENDLHEVTPGKSGERIIRAAPQRASVSP
jgi:hypothetical protein